MRGNWTDGRDSARGHDPGQPGLTAHSSPTAGWAPAGRAGNRSSFPAAPFPPSPRLLPARPEAAPHPTAATPRATLFASTTPPTAVAPSGPRQAKVKPIRPRPLRASGKRGAWVAPLRPGPTPCPGHPHPAGHLRRRHGGRGERADSDDRVGCPPALRGGWGRTGASNPSSDSRPLRAHGWLRGQPGSPAPPRCAAMAGRCGRRAAWRQRAWEARGGGGEQPHSQSQEPRGLLL
jgi:hypothetical protein